MSHQDGMTSHYSAPTILGVDISKLGERVVYLRNQSGLSLEKLAALSGVAKNTISAIENGHQNPEFATIIALEAKLGPIIKIASEASLPDPGPEGKTVAEQSLWILDVFRGTDDDGRKAICAAARVAKPRKDAKGSRRSGT